MDKFVIGDDTCFTGRAGVFSLCILQWPNRPNKPPLWCSSFASSWPCFCNAASASTICALLSWPSWDDFFAASAMALRMAGSAPAPHLALVWCQCTDVACAQRRSIRYTLCLWWSTATVVECLATACAHACDLRQADRQESQTSCTGHRLNVTNNIDHSSNQASY